MKNKIFLVLFVLSSLKGFTHTLNPKFLKSIDDYQSSTETKVYKAKPDGTKGDQEALLAKGVYYEVYNDTKTMKWKFKIDKNKIFGIDEKGEAIWIGEIENDIVYKVKNGKRYSAEGKVKDGKIYDDDNNKVIGFYVGKKEEAAVAVASGMFR